MILNKRSLKTWTVASAITFGVSVGGVAVLGGCKQYNGTDPERTTEPTPPRETTPGTPGTREPDPADGYTPDPG